MYSEVLFKETSENTVTEIILSNVGISIDPYEHVRVHSPTNAHLLI